MYTVLHNPRQAGTVAKDKAGQASDALESGARQAADAAQKVSKDTSEAIESGAQQARSLFCAIRSLDRTLLCKICWIGGV